MKQFFLAGALVALAALGARAESINIGGASYEANVTTTQVAPGVVYRHLHFPDRTYSGYFCGSSVHMIEADLTNPQVSVQNITSGITGTRTLEKHAASVNAEGHTVVGGANGNFWITSETPWKSQLSAWPWGISVSNGMMYTDPNARNCAHMSGPNRTGMVAITSDGRCVIDRLIPQGDDVTAAGWAYYVHHPRINHNLDLDMCNRLVYPGTASIYTKAYGADRAFKPVALNSDGSAFVTYPDCATELLCDLAEGETWHFGGTTKVVVKEVRTNAGTGTLGSHDLAIVGRDTYATVMEQHYLVGDELELVTKMNFEQGIAPEIAQAVSGNILAMKGGVTNDDVIKSESYNTSANERTIYATNADGTKMWIVVCEHNVKQTKKHFGFSLIQMCNIAKHYGATEATQVDCGGSAQMYAGNRQVSSSYDTGGIRAVHNGLFIVSSAPASEIKAAEVPVFEIPKSPVPEAVAGVAGPDSYDMETSYTDAAIAELAGCTPKRIFAKGDIAYILAFDAEGTAKVIVYNHTTGATVRTLGLGEAPSISDIALTADGMLIAIQRDPNAAINKAVVNIYRWNNDGQGIAQGNAIKWNISGRDGNWSNNDSGEIMAFVGSSTNGYIYYSSRTASGANIRWARLRLNENSQLADPTYNLQLAGYDYTTTGSGMGLMQPCPWNPDHFILEGTSIAPTEMVYESAIRGQLAAAGTCASAGTGARHAAVFTHKGTHYLAIPSDLGVRLAEVNNGLPASRSITLKGEFIGAVTDLVTGATVTDGLALLRLSGDKLSRYAEKTQGGGDDPDPTPEIYGDRAHSAYQLEMEGDTNTGYDLYYVMTGDVKSVNVRLTPIDSNGEVITLEAPAKKGMNTIHIDANQLPAGTYNWALDIQSYPVKDGGQFHKHAGHSKADARGGVGVVTDPESDEYGHIVTTAGYGQGFFYYSPELEYIGNYGAKTSPWNTGNRSDVFRIAMRNGNLAVATAYSDAGAGFWTFDPANRDAAIGNLSSLGTNDGKGCIKLTNGTVVGSGSPGIAFSGNSDDQLLWCFAEDYPTGNHANKGTLCYWKIGTADKITTPVAADFTAQKLIGAPGNLLANQNVNLTPYGDGVFASQTRANGSNSTDTPCILYVDKVGNITYNSGGDTNIPSSGGGLAISADGSRLAFAGNKAAIRLFNVAWSGNTPYLNFVMEIPGSTNTANSEVPQLAFDTAGNILAVHRSTTLANDGLYAFAIPGEQRPVSVPAKASYVVTGTFTQTGVANVKSTEEAPVEWFNLQGLRVDGDHLTPGIYIRRQGKVTKKVLIRR